MLFGEIPLNEDQTLFGGGEITAAELLNGFGFPISNVFRNRIIAFCPLGKPFPRLGASLFRGKDAVLAKGFPARLSTAPACLVLDDVALATGRENPRRTRRPNPGISTSQTKYSCPVASTASTLRLVSFGMSQPHSCCGSSTEARGINRWAFPG